MPITSQFVVRRVGEETSEIRTQLTDGSWSENKTAPTREILRIFAVHSDSNYFIGFVRELYETGIASLMVRDQKYVEDHFGFVDIEGMHFR